MGTTKPTTRAGSQFEMGAPEDRRSAPRLAVALDVDYRCEDNYLFAAITDISATGIFIRTLTPAPTGTRLTLRFDAHVGPLEVEGEVMWINPFRPERADSLHPGMGVRFVDVDAATAQELLELIRRIAYLPT